MSIRKLPVFLLLLSLSVASLTAQTLRDTAEQKGVYLGNIMSISFLQNPTGYDQGRHDDIMSNQFNAIVLENSMKMSFVLPRSQPANLLTMTPAQLAQTLARNNINRFLTYAEDNNLRARGHAMIWFNQAPNWLNSAGQNWTAQEVFDFSRTYIHALGLVCGDRVAEWDVINEAIADGNRVNWRTGTWYDNAGDGSETTYGPATIDNYIKMLFVWAREAQPNARLHYNDYSIEFFDTRENSKNDFMRRRMATIKAAGAPIDGIGFQSHFQLHDMVNNGNINAGFLTAVTNTMRWLADVDLEVAITELDIRICDNRGNFEDQRTAYYNFVRAALNEPNCRELLIWGMRDDLSWIETTDIFPTCNSAVIYENAGFDRKPAWFGVLDALRDLPDATFPPDFPPLNPGVVDPDGGQVDLLSGVTAPTEVLRGTTVPITVDYTATRTREITVTFQQDSGNFSVFSEATVQVPSGSGRVTIDVEIPSTVRVERDAYQFQTFIHPLFSGWPDRLANIARPNVSVVLMTSTNDLAATGLSAYPNPTAERVTLSGLEDGPQVIEVRSLDGRLTQRSVITVAGGTTEVNLREMRSGICLVSIVSDSGTRSVRVIKQ